MRRATQFTILSAAAAACLMMAAPGVRADTITFNNNAGDNTWENAGNWSSNPNLPAPGDKVILYHDATISSTQTVGVLQANTSVTLDVLPGAHLTSTGNGISSPVSGKTFQINVAGGTVDAAKMTTSGGGVLNVSITSGTLKQGSYFILNNAGSFTLSGGAFDGSDATSRFWLYGPDAAHRAAFNIVGSNGTFTLKNNLMLLNNNTASDPAYKDSASATDVNFTFGTTATLTTVYANGGLALMDNALAIDFTNITRPNSATNYSITLFDSRSISGEFATPTFIGLGTNETASVVKSADSKQYVLNFTLAPVPEPGSGASLLLLGAGGLLMLLRRRRERVTG